MTDLERLVAIEQICALEARRARLLDQRKWDELAALHVPEFSARTAAGEDLVGVEAMVAWIRQQMANADTVHHIHAPEITVEGPDRASGIWSIQAKSRFRKAEGETFRDTYGFYFVDYAKRDGAWKIAARRQEHLRVDEGPAPPVS